MVINKDPRQPGIDRGPVLRGAIEGEDGAHARVDSSFFSAQARKACAHQIEMHRQKAILSAAPGAP